MEEDLRQAVINQVNAVKSAMRRLEIQEQSVRIARTSYEITRGRYERGEIIFEQLTQSQDMFTQSEHQFLSDWIAYQLAKADLRALTLWDWEKDEPVVQRTTPRRHLQVTPPGTVRDFAASGGDENGGRHRQVLEGARDPGHRGRDRRPHRMAAPTGRW